tara:strand:+ start:366 stop:1604 length:1239 start_codon:yes stop_codon:yes gene_type:complete
MSNINTVQSLNANFKEVYADKIKDLVPSAVKLVNMIPFNKADKQLGLQYNQPVILGLENGFTYGGSDGEAFTLNASVRTPLKNAVVKGHELVLRSMLSVGAASRAVSNKNAFEQTTKLLIGNMLKSMNHRLEIQLMYGQAGLGIIESNSGAVLKIEDHEWAPATWNGSEGARVEVYSAAGALRGAATIKKISQLAKTVELDVLPAGTVATDVLYWFGAKDKEFIGLHAIGLKAGTLFGIDNTEFDLFRGNTVDVGTNFAGGEAVLSFAKIEESVAVAMEKGLGEEEVTVIVNPKSWNSLLTEQAAKRQYDESYRSSEIEQGMRAIRFYGMNGTIKIMASTFCKEGYAYAFCEKEFMRVGSSEITFDPPGYEGEFFKLMENANGYEIRCYTDQALFCARPACITVLRYIKSPA